MAVDSLFLTQEKLRKAEAEIATLRTVVDHTLAIIWAAGGSVDVQHADIDKAKAMKFRHEFDGKMHVFSVHD